MATPKRKYGYNPKPRLSANQLAEYLNATPTRRKSIIQAAKFPKTSIVARYERARTALAKYMADPTRLSKTLADAITDLEEREARVTATGWTKEDCRASIEAIRNFQKSYNALGLGKIKCKPIVGNQPSLSIEGVTISVALDATIHRVDKNVELVGGLILLFAKSEASARAREERCKVAAVLAALFAENHLKTMGQPAPKLSMALDVFGGRIYPSPGSAMKRLDNMRLACEEVALRWPTITAPADYDGP